MHGAFISPPRAAQRKQEYTHTRNGINSHGYIRGGSRSPSGRNRTFTGGFAPESCRSGSQIAPERTQPLQDRAGRQGAAGAGGQQGLTCCRSGSQTHQGAQQPLQDHRGRQGAAEASRVSHAAGAAHRSHQGAQQPLQDRAGRQGAAQASSVSRAAGAAHKLPRAKESKAAERGSLALIHVTIAALRTA